ncbi:nSTAND1 domain-containing NTPase [Sphingomonas nostoxanthinifaciens]|uniref:nSTAND1 domain-containing NTPase n=1 Tax=Sphingomonas nostoxanthinifaciens TaxID=2872652 RepID=UPI001CC1D395|nr:hypothetical protein [Sphingomonas nostoxanthinifaciens]UAK24306.1 hypothetical protein K8P63_18640 [Sphingomonas nostoxanthinifaciens]
MSQSSIAERASSDVHGRAVHESIGISERSPYMAAHSFGGADVDLFFGRDAQGVALARFMQDQRLSILTAPSGIGKTSLIQARVVPLLERQGWLTVLARPGDDPLQLMQQAMVEHLLPKPEIETAAIQRLAAEVPGGDETSLADVVAWYDALEFHDRVRFRFFAPPAASALPIFCRVLRGTMTLEEALEHYEALSKRGPFLGLSPHMPLGALRDRLEAASMAAAWADWCGLLTSAGSLIEVVQRLEQSWFPLRPGLAGLLLIVDQFEEVFTRLPPSWLDHFLAEVSELLDADASSDQRPGYKPVQIMVSLRKEFFADILPRLEPFGTAEQMTFFLGALTQQQAREALASPLEKLGIRFDPALEDGRDTLDRMLDQMREDDDESGESAAASRHFPAMVVSLLGAHVWSRLRDMPVFQSLLDGERSFVWDDFTTLVPKLENVFEEFLASVLERLPDDDARFDAVELLDRLTTSGGYRNIILEEDLIDQLPLRQEEAKALLARLDQNLRLIRRESRRGGRYVEIVHERLIAPVRRQRAQLQRQNPVRAILPHAVDQLYLVREDDVDPLQANPLSQDYREALLRYLGRLQLDALALKVLLANTLLAGQPRGVPSERWHASVRALAKELAHARADDMERPILREGEALDRALDIAGTVEDFDWRWLATRSALADVSDQAGRRVRRAIAIELGGARR